MELETQSVLLSAKRPYHRISQTTPTRPPPGAMRRKQSDEDAVRGTLERRCCSSMHTQNIAADAAKFRAALKERKHYWALSHQGKDAYLLSLCRDHAAKRRRKQLYHLSGLEVCTNGVQRILGISNRRHHAVLKLARQGVVQVVREERQQRASTKDQILAWLKRYVQMVGETMPDTGKIQLPPTSVTEIHYEYLQHAAQLGEKYINYNYFTKIFAKHFKHVTIPKFKRFSKCSDCIYYNIRKSHTVDEAELEDLRLRKLAHRKQSMEEKEKYYDHRFKSRTTGRHLCIMYDGMDQGKTILPWFFRMPGAASQLILLKTHVVGYLLHEKTMMPKVFTVTDRWKHDSNLTIETLIRSLTTATKPLPEVLYIQADNCWRENKSQKVFSFLAWLVKEDIFRKVFSCILVDKV